MTDIEICGMALGFAKTKGIVSFDDDTAQARACKAFYGPIRDLVLEDRVWTFARRQYVLDAPDLAPPAFKYARRFGLPAEIIRVHRVYDADMDPDIDWELHGRFILTGEKKLYATAVRREEDASLYTPGFCLALALRLGTILAIPFAENRQLKADLWDEYKVVIKEASGADGSQGRGEAVEVDFLKRARD